MSIGYSTETFENCVKKLKELYNVDLTVKQDKKIKQGKSKVEIIKLYKDFLEEQ